MILTQKCTRCDKEKTLDNFYLNVKRNYRNPKCKECAKKYIKENPNENKKILNDITKSNKWKSTNGYISRSW